MVNEKNLLQAESPLSELSEILALTVICPHFLLISCLLSGYAISGVNNDRFDQGFLRRRSTLSWLRCRVHSLAVWLMKAPQSGNHSHDSFSLTARSAVTATQKQARSVVDATEILVGSCRR